MVQRGATPLTTTRRPIVLVIEDEEGPRRTFQSALRSHAAEVLAASTGPEGLRLAVARQPHIVLLDFVLPGLHGIHVLEQMRFDGVLARVLVITGHLTDALEARARELGALAVLEKVVTLDQLFAAFRTAVAADGPIGNMWWEGLESTAAGRWVALILKSLQAPGDPRISQEVAARGAMSLSQMKLICQYVGITPRATCGLARCLGGIVWSRRLLTEFESLMSFGDSRTMRHLLEHAGLVNRTATATVRNVLDAQRFVPPETLAFRLLRRALLGEPVEEEPR